MSTPTVGTIVNTFAVKFNQLLHSSDSASNYVFSPLSLVSALAMCYGGAEKDTKVQFEKLLSISGDDFHKNYEHHMKTLRAATKSTVTLKMANRLYTQDGFSVEEKFTGLLKSHYGGMMGTFSASDPERSSQAINSFVQELTNGMVSDLVPTGAIVPDALLIIINAIYFKGDWEKKFDPDLTETLPFYVTPTSTVDVRMMTKRNTMATYVHDEELKAQWVELAYRRSGFVFTAIVPDELDGLEHVMSRLTPKRLARTKFLMQRRELHLIMPKFEIEYTVPGAEKMLQQLGLVDAFSPAAADFSKLSTREKLFISAVIHKAKIVVNEEGAEASAASAIITKKGCSSHRIIINMNRPFLYMIRELDTNSIVFMGRMTLSLSYDGYCARSAEVHLTLRDDLDSRGVLLTRCS